jgi:hypothetical protein
MNLGMLKRQIQWLKREVPIPPRDGWPEQWSEGDRSKIAELALILGNRVVVTPGALHTPRRVVSDAMRSIRDLDAYSALAYLNDEISRWPLPPGEDDGPEG